MNDLKTPQSVITSYSIHYTKLYEITGESLFLTHFANQGWGKKHVAFSAPYPGTIIPLDLARMAGRIIVQKDAFLCAALGTKISITFNRRLGAGFFGGEGFIMQQLEGDGKAFIHAGGVITSYSIHYTKLYDLKFRIQASIIAIVLFSLLLVASGTIYYNLREYKNKHQYDLNEKMKSIAEEINLRLKNVDEFTPDVLDWLWQDLGDLSNIFRTDINIYSFNGELIASSRPEVFNRGIIV